MIWKYSWTIQQYYEALSTRLIVSSLQPYKERDMVAASERLGADSRMSGQEGPYSSPRFCFVFGYPFFVGPYSSPRWRFCVLICFPFFSRALLITMVGLLKLTRNIWLFGKQSMNINYNLIQDSKRFQCWILWHSSPQDSSLTKVCVRHFWDRMQLPTHMNTNIVSIVLNSCWRTLTMVPCRPGSQPGSDGEEEEGVSRCAQYLAR